MIMKKNRIFGLLLASALTMQTLFMPVFAAPEEEPDSDPTASSAASEPSVPSSSEPATLPTEFVIPEHVDGDASILMGSRTLDAQRPLADKDDYTAKVKAAIMYEMNSDTLILAQDADVQLYPASLTKVMTCLLTMEHADLADIVTVRGETINDLDPAGTSAHLKDGEQMSVEHMLYCLMVASANDGACVLAEHVAGDVDSFVEMMNQKALELGCTGTHFANPHGLHDENHYTTARDMAKIFKAALEYPVFHEIFGVDYYTVPATNLSEARELESTNYLIRNAGYPVVIDSRVLGGKTGFTTPAGRCLVALAEKDGMKMLTVIMGAKATYGSDGYSILRYGNFEENINLIDFGYETYETAMVLAPDQVMGQFPVTGGAHNAFGTVQEASYVVVPKGSGYDSVQYQYTIADGNLQAPVREKDPIGVVRVWFEDKCVAEQTLLAASDVAVMAASPAQEQDTQQDPDNTGLWHLFLMAALGVLAVVVVFLILVRIRAASRRARRKKTRGSGSRGKDQRRRRQ